MAPSSRPEGRKGVPIFQSPLKSRPAQNLYFSRRFKMLASAQPRTLRHYCELIAAYFTLAGDAYSFGPSQISPFPFRDRVEAVARAGWKGIGMIPDDVDATAAKIGHAEMKRILAANGIKYFELEFLVDWYLDGERRKISDAYRRRILAIAETFGARNVKVAPGLPQDVRHPRPVELVPDIPRMQE